MTTPQSPGQWPDPTYQSPTPGWPASGSEPPPPTGPAYPTYQVPPQASAPGYGTAPGYGQPGPYVVAARPTNGMALAAMIVALAGLVTCIAFPVGAVLGHIALKQVRQTGEQGEGYAKTGIIVGWIGTGLAIVGCGLYVALIGTVLRELPTITNTNTY